MSLAGRDARTALDGSIFAPPVRQAGVQALSVADAQLPAGDHGP